MTLRRRVYDCPTPKKSRFATQEAADEAARQGSFALDKQLYTYDTCLCGWIHITSKESRVRESAMLADPATCLTDAFMVVVREDTDACAHPDDAAALRRNENLDRWQAALHALLNELSIQMLEKVGDRSREAKEWRRRVEVRRLRVTTRLDECKVLLQDRRRTYLANRDAARGKRRDAGERAIKRLIEAHEEEFRQYLTEECAAEGVGLPKKMQALNELDELKERQETS